MKDRKALMSLSNLVGLGIGLFVVFVMLTIFFRYSQAIIGDDDLKKLESSLDNLQRNINDLKFNETKEGILFNVVNKEIYLMAYNEDSTISDCFRVSCIALCFDKNCENILKSDKGNLVRDIGEGLVFEKTGVIAGFEKTDSQFISLTIGNKQGVISITPS